MMSQQPVQPTRRPSQTKIVATVGPELSQIAMRGTYSPPLGPLGRALDRAVLHRVAEASVKGFVDRVAQSVGGGAAAA